VEQAGSTFCVEENKKYINGEFYIRTIMIVSYAPPSSTGFKNINNFLFPL
jgi:hypothetical protein